jgi:hypothetical protein
MMRLWRVTLLVALAVGNELAVEGC